MSPELERSLVLRLVDDRPLPWSIEVDWTVEVRDAKGGLVAKVMTTQLAEELVEIATRASEEFEAGLKEVEDLLLGGTK